MRLFDSSYVHPVKVISLVFLLFLFSRCRNAPASESYIHQLLSIEVASEIVAGEPVVVIVRGGGDRPITLIWRDGYATRHYTIEMRDGVAVKEIVETQTAGIATVSAETVSATISILAGEAVEPIIPLVAPKTIVVGGRETSMGVAVPFDRFGNLVRNGTPITFTVRRPDETQTKLPTTIQNGLGWRDIGSGRLAGDTALTAKVETAASMSATLREVPTVARPIQLVHPETTFLADGRTRIPLQTERLYDRFGNQLTDGLIVEFVIEGTQSTTVLTGVVIRGIAETTLLAPVAPQAMRVTARVGEVESEPLVLEFAQFVEPFALNLRAEPAQNALIVQSGTLQSGSIVPDGSIGRMLVVQEDGVLLQEISAETQQGHITQTVYLSKPLKGTYTVFLTIGGQTEKAKVAVE